MHKLQVVGDLSSFHMKRSGALTILMVVQAIGMVTERKNGCGHGDSKPVVGYGIVWACFSANGFSDIASLDSFRGTKYESTLETFLPFNMCKRKILVRLFISTC